MRTRIFILAVLLAKTAVFGAGDNMQSYHVEVCGAAVTMDLHPGMTQPAVLPRKVDDGDLPKPGAIDKFAYAMYDYKGSRKLDVDGSVIVSATAARRPAKEIAQGLSTFDIDHLIERMMAVDSESHYEKVERNGDTWIKRTTLTDVAPGEGRTLKLEWLVPLTPEVLLIFRVELADYGITKKKPEARKWYADAEALQKRIFESLQVERKHPSGNETPPQPQVH